MHPATVGVRAVHTVIVPFVSPFFTSLPIPTMF